MKKITCTILAAAMLASGVYAVPVSAKSESKVVSEGNVTSKRVEDILSAVKSKITVPDKLNKFTVNSYVDEKGHEIYNFSWRTEEYGYSSATMEISADSSGDILYYYYYDGEEFDDTDGVVISDISKSQIKVQIEECLKAMIPEKFDKLEQVGNVESNGNSYTIRYNRKENGLVVYGDNVDVQAYCKDGKAVITSLSCFWNDSEIPAVTDGISVDEAAGIYKEKSKFGLSYGVKSKKNKYDAFLRYTVKELPFIDATTGEVVENNQCALYDREFGMATAGAMKEDASVNMITPEEQLELDSISGLMSYADAEKKARSIKELGIDSAMKVVNKNLVKHNDNQYTLSLNFESEDKYTTVRFDAKNGDLYGMYCGDYKAVPVKDEKGHKIKLTDKEKTDIENKIEAFAKKYVPEYYKSVRKTELRVDDDRAILMFERINNNIPVAYDGITVTWDIKNKKITSLYANRSDISSFPTTDGIISEDEAYKALLKNAGLEKMYVDDGEEMKVVYGIANTENTYIDPYNGASVEADGTQKNTFSGYTDISGHWAENIINTLAEYNVRTGGSEFKPEECITQKQLLAMLYVSKYSYNENDTDRLYNMLISSGIINKSEVNPEATVTKQQAVVYLLRMMGYKNAAEIKDIYKCSFADADSIAESYFGYVAIAKGLGIISGDENDNFNPEKNITNAEAAVVIYNYLKTTPNKD